MAKKTISYLILPFFKLQKCGIHTNKIDKLLFKKWKQNLIFNGINFLKCKIHLLYFHQVSQINKMIWKFST